MTSLQELERNFEGLAQTDPLWAVLSDPSRKGGKWKLEEFFESGTREISTVIQHLDAIGAKPRSDGLALDFGCGVGRLTQALAQRFASCVGVDIASNMIARANELNRFPQQCNYVVNKVNDLKLFEANNFDFIYSSIVLQHINPVYSQEYVREFLRVLKPGGYAVFQMPDSVKEHIPGFRERFSDLLGVLRVKLALRRRLRRVAPRLFATKDNVSVQFPADAFDIEMHCVPEESIRRIVSESGGSIMDIVYTNSTERDFNGRLRYLRDEPSAGIISKQYCVTKPMLPPGPGFSTVK
jgi:SAM-dependent methyltransferase